MDDFLGKKGISITVAVIVSIIVTAIVVGAGTYMATPKKKKAAPGKVSKSGVESFLENADRSMLKGLTEDYVPQDVISEVSKKPRSITLAWNHPYPATGETWNMAFMDGLKTIMDTYPNVNLIHKAGLGAEDVKRLDKEAIKDGADIVIHNFEFTGLKDKKITEDYPDTYFACVITGNLSTKRNFIRFYPKEYQAIYLAGMVAGGLTDTDHIGIVGAKRVSEVARRMNAFTLGVRSVNPDAKVYVRWVDKWYVPATESEVAKTLIEDYNCDVLSQQTDSSAPVKTAVEKGVWFIGKDVDVVGEGWATGETVATSFAWNWETWLKKIISERMLEREHPKNFYFGGMESFEIFNGKRVPSADIICDGKLGVNGISSAAKEEISQDIIDKIGKRRKMMMEGNWDPFLKKVVASGATDEHEEGEIISPAGEVPTPEELKLGYYFVKGIVIP